MDSLSMMLNRLRYNDPNFKDRVRKIAYVYSIEFDADTVLELLREDTLRAEGTSERKEQGEDWVVEIPNILISNENVTIPDHVIIYNKIEEKEIKIPFPESIEEFRSMCKAHGVKVSLNTKTAVELYG